MSNIIVEDYILRNIALYYKNMYKSDLIEYLTKGYEEFGILSDIYYKFEEFINTNTKESEFKINVRIFESKNINSFLNNKSLLVRLVTFMDNNSLYKIGEYKTDDYDIINKILDYNTDEYSKNELEQYFSFCFIDNEFVAKFLIHLGTITHIQNEKNHILNNIESEDNSEIKKRRL